MMRGNGADPLVAGGTISDIISGYFLYKFTSTLTTQSENGEHVTASESDAVMLQPRQH
jgi:hypothetical protein